MKKLNTKTAVILGVVLALVAAVYFFGLAMGIPAELHASFVGGVGAVGAMILAAVKNLFATDADGDGVPDVVDGDVNTGGES